MASCFHLYDWVRGWPSRQMESFNCCNSREKRGSTSYSDNSEWNRDSSCAASRAVLTRLPLQEHLLINRWQQEEGHTTTSTNPQPYKLHNQTELGPNRCPLQRLLQYFSSRSPRVPPPRRLSVKLNLPYLGFVLPFPLFFEHPLQDIHRPIPLHRLIQLKKGLHARSASHVNPKKEKQKPLRIHRLVVRIIDGL